jgi:signal transduction histidine kinase
MSPNIGKEQNKIKSHGIKKVIDSHDLRMIGLIEGEERERKRFAFDLHDGLGQILTAAKYCLEGLSEVIPPRYEDEYKICCELLSSAITETSNISHGLMPASLADFGLNMALSDLCKHALLINGHSIRFECNEKEEIKFDDFKELMIFRIVQEGISNIQKHAGATQASVSLQLENNKVVLLVSDNGLGFDMNETQQGFGLLSICDRSKLLGGSCSLKSEPGKGTRIRICFYHNSVVN